MSCLCRIRTSDWSLVAIPSKLSGLPPIHNTLSKGRVCLIRDSNQEPLKHMCKASLACSPAARFLVHQYVCQWGFVTIANEPAPPPPFVGLLPQQAYDVQDRASLKVQEKTIRVMNRDVASNCICLGELLSPWLCVVFAMLLLLCLTLETPVVTICTTTF